MLLNTYSMFAHNKKSENILGISLHYYCLFPLKSRNNMKDYFTQPSVLEM